MWTQPQSVVDLFSSVPLDPDYNQTIFFNSAPPDNDTVSTQLNFFRSAFPYATWNNVSYIKPTSRSVRLELQPGQTFEIIRNFNYMRFCNYDSNRTYYDGDANDSHKSYYAFVDFIEYINEKTIEVNFTIDPIQTYMFNYTLNQCFIERQHSSTDDVGDNLVAESFDLGNDYIINSHAEQISTANRVCILINRVNNRDTTEQTETVNLDGQTQVFVLSTSFTQIISISTDGDPSTILGWDYDAQTKTLTFYQVPDGTRLTVVGLVNLIPTTESKLHSGVFTPIVTATYPCVTLQDAQTIDDYLNEYNENDIICIYQYPDFLGTPDNEGATIIHLDLPTDLDGYHFKNNKLLTYPYCYIQGSNHSGGLATYNWELFNELEYTESGVTHDGVSFSIDGSIIGIPQAAMVPLDYRGVVNNHGAYNYDWDSALTLSNFPQCAWAGDTFKAWWAQNKAGFITSTITGALTGAQGGFNQGANYYSYGYQPFNMLNTGNISGGSHVGAGGTALFGSAGAAGLAFAGANLAVSSANAMAKIYDIKHTPSQTHGQVQQEYFNTKHGLCGFSVYVMSIRGSIARTIDDYFSRFGYAQHIISTPNRAVRNVFTYVQTQGCTISGTVPAEYEKQICSIYDRGITWWKKSYGTHMGEYYNYFNANRIT